MYLNNTEKMNSSLNWMGLNNTSEPFIPSSFSLKEIDKHMLFLVILSEILIFLSLSLYLIKFFSWYELIIRQKKIFLFSHSMIEINNYKYEPFDFK